MRKLRRKSGLTDPHVQRQAVTTERVQFEVPSNRLQRICIPSVERIDDPDQPCNPQDHLTGARTELSWELSARASFSLTGDQSYRPSQRSVSRRPKRERIPADCCRQLQRIEKGERTWRTGTASYWAIAGTLRITEQRSQRTSGSFRPWI